MSCFCKNEAKKSCVNCGIGYCSRECQVKDWPEHKLKCKQSKEQEYLKYATMKIAGNIQIMAAHRFAKHGPGAILVEMNESITSFMKGDSLHIAYLSFLPRGVPDDKISVVYKFDDYTTTQIINRLNINLSKAPEPEDNWSIIFMM